MSQVIKSFLGVFFLLSMLLLGIGILSAQTDVADALDYKADIIAELENSNYNAKVMEACIRQAKESGYEVEITTYTPEKQTAVYTTDNVSDTTDVVMAEVKLTYPYRIGFLNAVTDHQVRGYAR